MFLYALGGLDGVEFDTLDVRFQWLGTTTEHPDILCVDIDDESLETIGRWPWSRQRQAAVIDVLNEAGARAILYDITLVEPEPVTAEAPRNAAVALNPEALSREALHLNWPDHTLAAALRRFERTYLAFHFGSEARPSDPSLRAWIRAWLNKDPDRWTQWSYQYFEALHHSVRELPNPSFTTHRDAVQLALLDVLNTAATRSHAQIPREKVFARHVDTITGVHYPHARAARQCGFVVFETDGDNVMRRMRLFVENDGVVLPQLALALAMDELAWEPDGGFTQAGIRTQRFKGPAGAVSVQIDHQGRVLLPWVPRRTWLEQFIHLPIDAVWQVHGRRARVRENLHVVLDALETLQADGYLTAHKQYADDLRQVLRLHEDRQRARAREDATQLKRIRKWLQEYDAVLPEAALALRVEVTDTLSNQGETGDVLRHYEQIERAFAANDTHEAAAATAFEQVQAAVGDRLCLVGYTATSLADMAPIPTSPRAPGVIAHANLLNGLLTGSTMWWTPAWMDLLLILMLGAVSAFLATIWRPDAAGWTILAVGLLYIVLVGVAFAGFNLWVALVPPLLALWLTYFTVLLFRYLFLQRESRQLATALGQYTSATLARQMAEDVELCKRAETREVTALFTDLAGFTNISERIGAERTQKLLNTSLGRLSDVLLQHEAMINKFIGDGIFAFWNPVIFPQEDHARRACASALLMQKALRELILKQQAIGGDEAFAELELRIGLATGNAVVGPCGSEQKYDYTCIGDTVNVASRLESANKSFGTHILINGTTWEQAGGEAAFATRRLGAVQVKGKSKPVPVYELLGYPDDVPPNILQYADRFSVALTAFQEQHWPAARQILAGCLEERPHDRAALLYLRLVEQYTATPPLENWNGAVELTEK
jgi:adenylate cyclase